LSVPYELPLAITPRNLQRKKDFAPAVTRRNNNKEFAPAVTRRNNNKEFAPAVTRRSTLAPAVASDCYYFL